MYFIHFIEVDPKAAEERKNAAKKTIEDILKELDMESPEMTTKEADKLKELDKIFTENPDLKDMSVEELVGMLNLSEEDKKNLNQQVQTILQSGDINAQNESLNKQFPAIDPAMNDMMNKIQEEFAQTPGLQEEFTSWMKSVQEKLGPNLDNINTMSEEEVNQISLPPPRLRAVFDKYIPDMDKFNDLSLDDGMELGTEADKTEDTEEGEPIEIEEIKLH